MVAAALAQFLQRHPAGSYLLAFSGGLDSTVLLHALSRLLADQPAVQLRVMHINHGLQPAAADWVEQCQMICAELQLPLQVMELGLQVPSGASLEAVAREARYQAFLQELRTGEILLTAHHQDDQVETLLLNLLRGSGIDGLAAMPALRALGNFQLGRPLLGVSRAALEQYAHDKGLRWIDDPSNLNTIFDRNFLRQQVLPLLQQRWPAVAKSLAQAAHWQGEYRSVLEGYLAQDLPEYAGLAVGSLSVNRLRELPEPQCKALVRYWLQQQGFSVPPAGRMRALLDNVLPAKADANPVVSWAGCELRRYRDDLFALPPSTLYMAHEATAVYHWPDPTMALVIPALGLTLWLADFGIAVDDVVTHKLSVRFRVGGERLHRVNQPTISLKQLFQQQGIPPWQRDRMPLLYAGEELIAVLGLYPHHQSLTKCN